MQNKLLSRRAWLRAAGGAAALGAIPFTISKASAQSGRKPNSKVAGVQLGVTTYSYGSMPHKVDDVVQYLLYAGVNSIELRNVAEEDLGIPEVPRRPRGGAPLTEQEKAELAKAAESVRAAQRQWRLSLPMERYAQMRKKFNDAGIEVYIAKFAPSAWSDEEIDYAYTAAKTLGSIGITDELSEQACRRLGTFAEKHKSLAMFHTHGQVADAGFSFDKYLAYSPANLLNLDAATTTGDWPASERCDREVSRPDAQHPHQGQDGAEARHAEHEQALWPGRDTDRGRPPVAQEGEVADQGRRRAEYPIPEGSDAAKETKKCIDYMRNILE